MLRRTECLNRKALLLAIMKKRERDQHESSTLHRQNGYNHGVAILRYDTKAVSRALRWIYSKYRILDS